MHFHKRYDAFCHFRMTLAATAGYASTVGVRSTLWSPSGMSLVALDSTIGGTTAATKSRSVVVGTRSLHSTTTIGI